MDQANILYIVFFFSLILMFYVLHKIWNKSDYKTSKRWIYTYVTLLFPIIGFFIINVDRNKLKA